MTQSPELAGGAGFTYADQVATRYLAALLAGSGAPGLRDQRVARVALEQRDAGEPLDDIVVDGEAPDGSVARLSLQVKREITISAARKNKDFRDIVRDSWSTLDKPDFRDGVDRVGAAAGPSTAVGKWRDLVALAQLAAASATPADFAVRFGPGGSASKEHRAILEDLQTVTAALGRPATVDDMHPLLRHFVLIRFDALHEGATEDPATVELAEQALAPGQAGQAAALADRLRAMARLGAGTARSWDRGGLRLDVAPWFGLAADRWLAADLDALMAEVRPAAASILDRIGEATLDRARVRAKVARALAEHQLVTLRGLPGSGKSVILRREVEAALSRGPTLLLKADRLTGGSWAQYATSIGLAQHDPVPLLREIATVGTPTLFIDGLDRIDRAQRGIVVDLIEALEAHPGLSGWRVLATLRDSGVEPVRTWPDDFRLWMRFLRYLDVRMGAIPRRLLPQVLTLFEVWQNAFADSPNPISAMIVEHAAGWLSELEQRQEQMGRFRRRDEEVPADPWGGVEGIGEFEGALRRLVLRAGRSEPTRVSAYLGQFDVERSASSKAFEDIMAFAPLLSQALPSALADFTLNHLRRELPEDHRRRRLEEERRSAEYRDQLRRRPEDSLDWGERMSLSSPNLGYWGPDRWDWDALSIERNSFGYFPASPLHQPFQALFENAPDEALRLVRSMSNHAVEAWRQLHRFQTSSGTPVPVEIAFPWGTQTFWGGVREYLWSRGLCAPKPLASAYLALDKWALDQVEAGADGDQLIERIVRGNDSIASLGIALHVALARPAVTPVNEVLVTTQRLWRADIQRYVQEASVRSSSQIGFWREHHRKDAIAVEALNTLPVRSEEIRSLATLHVLQVDAVAAQRVRDAITAFADAPDFELEEERNHPGARDHAAEQARTYAAWGDLAHYRLVDVPDQPNWQAIVMVNPILEEPGIRERLEEGQEHLRTFALFHWAEKSLEQGAVADAMTIEQGVASARSLDDGTLFQPSTDDDQISLRRGAVAGAAAVVVAFAPVGPDVGWAREVMTRAADCPEEGGPLWSSVGIVGWHHVIFVARAAAADLRREPTSRKHAADLLATLIHPLDNVGLATATLLASLWDVAPGVCWVGLGLALDLCIVAPGNIGANSMHDPNAGAEAQRRKLDAALARLNLDAAPLPIPPTPWAATTAEDHRRLDRLPDEEDEPGTAPMHWRSADGWWRSDRAGEILAKQPARAILTAGFEAPFVTFCEAMLAWTIERRAPVWASRARDIDKADVMEWTHRLGDVLGVLVGLIDPQRAEATFIAPICAVDEEDTCFDLLTPLVTMFICQHVLDSAEVAPISSVVLERSLDRLLAAPTFSRTAYRAGELHGFSMPQLARWLMFVGVEKAALAHRFSNGDWSDIAVILPTVDRFVRTVGWAPTVMEDFLTLAERSRDHFPTYCSRLKRHGPKWVFPIRRFQPALCINSCLPFPTSYARASR